jgi:hypothetical protein
MGMVVGLETRHKTRYSPFKSFHEIETGISEQSKRVPIFLHDVREGKPSEFLFGQKLRLTQGNWDQALEAWQVWLVFGVYSS